MLPFNNIFPRKFKMPMLNWSLAIQRALTVLNKALVLNVTADAYFKQINIYSSGEWQHINTRMLMFYTLQYNDKQGSMLIVQRLTHHKYLFSLSSPIQLCHSEVAGLKNLSHKDKRTVPSFRIVKRLIKKKKSK